jgi:hypothetical protein
MGVEVIDGTIESAAVRKSGASTVIYDSITIRTTAGTERRLEKVAVAPAVAAALTPGTEGRFYGYKAIDHRGLLGIRVRGGRAQFALPTGNENIMLMATFAGLGAFIVLLLLGKGVALLAAIASLLGLIGYLKYRRTRLDGRARYDADSDYV